MLAEDLEHTCPWQPTRQRGGLLACARRPQAVQQSGHAVLVVKGDCGGGIAVQQLGDLLLRARLQASFVEYTRVCALGIRAIWGAKGKR